jgi:diaminopimelate epimerase
LRGREIPAAIDIEQVVDYPLKIGGKTIAVTALSTGTPHAVIFTGKLEEIGRLGPAIMSHPFFPEQASVSFVKTEGKKRLLARTWERGEVGESLSCGTGAAAILAAAHLKGLTSREAEVVYAGGRLQVRWDCEGNLWVAGPAREVFEARIEI